MKNIIFDSGPIISLATNNLLWILEELKKKYRGEFLITESVKKEIVDYPLQGKKYKFEALQVLKLLNDGILKVYYDEKIKSDTLDLLTLANHCFYIHSKNISIVQYSEVEVIVLALKLNSDAIIVDERTLRWLVEKPEKIKKLLEMRMHEEVGVDAKNLKKFNDSIKNINVLRSIELAARAFELGLLNRFIPKMPNAKKALVEGLLWGIKLNGCAISNEELEKIINLESKS